MIYAKTNQTNAHPKANTLYRFDKVSVVLLLSAKQMKTSSQGIIVLLVNQQLRIVQVSIIGQASFYSTLSLEFPHLKTGLLKRKALVLPAK